MSEIPIPVITFSEKKENKTQEAGKGMGCQHVSFDQGPARSP